MSNRMKWFFAVATIVLVLGALQLEDVPREDPLLANFWQPGDQ